MYTYFQSLFYHQNLCVLLDFTIKTFYNGSLEHVANACGSWLSMKGAPLKQLSVIFTLQCCLTCRVRTTTLFVYFECIL